MIRNLIKKFLTISIFTSLIFGFTFTAQASGSAEYNFSLETKQVKVGESFNLDLLINPKGEEVDTVRAIVNFSADKLEVEHFALGSLFPNVSPANEIDNNNGIISQGGFRIGNQTSESGVFGTITFKALKEGTAVVSLAASSKIISGGEEKINNTHLPQVTVEISEAEKEAPKYIAVTEEGETVFTVSSSTHPDSNKWYNINDIKVEWQVDKSDMVESFLYDFNKDPGTDPSQSLPATAESLIFEGVQNDLWYFHIKAKLKEDKYTQAIHFAFKIDTVTPNRIYPLIEKPQITEDETTQLRFGATDQTSGIDYYTVKIGDQDYGQQTSPFEIKDLKAGEHAVVVTGYDKAGNTTSTETKIEVTPGVPWVEKVSVVKKYGWQIAIALIIIIVVIIVVIKIFKKVLKK